MRKIVKDLRTKSVKDLEKDANTIRQEIAKMTLESAVQPVKDSNTIVKKRKQLAILLTLANENKEAKVSTPKSK